MYRTLKHVLLLVILAGLMLTSSLNVVKADPPYPELSTAFAAYRSSTGTNVNYPKNREWSSSAWGSESEMANAGSPIQWVRVAYNPASTRYYEKIVVTLSNDGYLDAYVWTGSSWSVTNQIGNVGTTAAAYRPFDIAYEKTTGKAMLVYGAYTTSTSYDLAYKTWGGTSWSSVNYINDAGHATDIQYYWVALASKPTSGANEIAMIALDGTSSDANGWIWSGTAWGNYKELTDTASIATKEDIAVAYEQQSGNATLVYATGSDAYSLQWSGTAWDSAGTLVDLSGTSTPNWFSLKADPVSDKLMLVSVDGDSDLNIAYWSGAAWTINYGGFTEDDAVDTNAARCADFDWEPTGSKGLLVLGTTAGEILAMPFNGTSWPVTAVGTLRPNAVGDYTEYDTLVGTGLTQHWEAVDEVTSDGDTSYIATAVSGDKDVFNLPNGTIPSDAAISSVKVYAVLRKTAGGDKPKPNLMIRTYGNDYFGADISPSQSYAVYSEEWTTNPYTASSWTVAEINALQAGVRSNAADYHRVTQIYVEVTYTSPRSFTATMGANIHPWVQLRRNQRAITGDVEILGAVLEGTVFDLGAIKWDGTTFTVIGSSTFTADTGTSSYECFEIEFSYYAIPISSVFVWPASQSATAGFYVYVNITSTEECYGWEFKLYYDTTMITAVNVTLGPFLNDTAGTGNTFGSILEMNDSYNSTHGRVWLTQTIVGHRRGASGTGKSLARIGFSIDASSTSFLRLRDTSLIGYHYDYRRIFNMPHTTTDGTVTLPAIPEFPLGVALEIALAATLIYMWRRSKRKPNSYNHKDCSAKSTSPKTLSNASTDNVNF